MPTFLLIIISLFYSAAIGVWIGYSVDSGYETFAAGSLFGLIICAPIAFLIISLILYFVKKKLDPKKFLQLLFALAVLFPIVLFLYQFFVRGGILDHLLVK